MALMDKWQQYFYAIPKNWTKINQKSRETIRRLSEHLAPFPVFEPPKEDQLVAKWQQICLDNGLLVSETVLTHTFYQFDCLNQFRNVLQAMCHFLPFIPEDKRDEFLSEYLQLVDDLYIAKQFDTKELTDESPVRLSYDNIVVVAVKHI
ncbi:unnamed protein product [Oppiella nova]|uniref:Uncharacterized protein n=1 Tax=Oppiella nova TaxID=334625 RepID=A0A7R9MP82_9ACAR|nr:unnamed protein product [Oppiella nova]CAG2180659.1 unnamed protein product [Oppiella nova]